MFRRLGLLAYSIMFLRGGWNQVNAVDRYIDQAQKAGVPATAEIIKASGYSMIACGVMLQLPFLRRLAGLILALQLPVITYVGHRFWEHEDPQMRRNQQTHFFKNLSMLGAALYIAGTK